MKTPEGKTILISADSFFRDADAQLMELKGNVQVVYGDQVLSCDHALVRLGKSEVIAEGHILLISPATKLSGERATINYATETGVIENGFVESQQVALEGKIIRKTGPKSYIAEDANFTACSTCPPGWKFSGSKIEAELGGYARIKNPFFKIAYFPIPFWLPYIVVPLKSDRQTGFLTPVLGFEGVGGTSLAEPYFWAISRSQDATFTAKEYSARGPKGILNYRYALTKDTGGELKTAVIQDQVFPSDLQLAAVNQAAPWNRYFVNYKGQVDLPQNFQLNSKINLASDLYYARDFPEEFAGYGDPAFENRISLAKDTETTHSSIDVSYYVNELERNPVSSNGDTVHRMPELRFSETENRVGNSPVLFKFDTDFVSFVRNSPSYDHVVLVPPNPLSADELARIPQNYGIVVPKYVDNSRNNSGQQAFVPNQDQIRVGQRLDLHPEFSRPFHMGRYLDISPSLGARHTQYSFSTTGSGQNFNTTPYRDYLQAQLSGRTRFSNVYTLQGPEDSVHEERLKHEIVPELSITTLPYLYQSQSSFFGAPTPIPPFLTDLPIADTDFYGNRGVQFDYFDRLINRNVVTASLSNKLIKKSWSGNEASYKQIVLLKFSQSYDLDQANIPNPNSYPLSDFSSLLDVRLTHFETNTLVRYYPYHGYVNTTSRVKVMDTKGDFGQISFNQLFLINDLTNPNPNPYLGPYLKRTENIGLTGAWKSKYLDFLGNVDLLPVNWNNFNFSVVDWSTTVNLKPPGNCWALNFVFQQVIGYGLTYTFGFDYNFGT